MAIIRAQSPRCAKPGHYMNCFAPFLYFPQVMFFRWRGSTPNLASDAAGPIFLRSSRYLLRTGTVWPFSSVLQIGFSILSSCRVTRELGPYQSKVERMKKAANQCHGSSMV